MGFGHHVSSCFPSSTFQKPIPCSAEIPTASPACKPAPDGAPHARPCSTTSRCRPATASPSHPCGMHQPHRRRQAPLQASPRTVHRSGANPALASSGVQLARFSSAGTPRCGADNLTHFTRTLCICVKIDAIVRTPPGGLARQQQVPSSSISRWLMQSFAAKTCAAASPD